MHDTFGNGSPWASFATDPVPTLAELNALAPWFLVLYAKGQAPATMLEDPTSSLSLPRTITNTSTSAVRSGEGAPPGTTRFVFRVKRAPRSQFDFISLGRNPGNDISVPDESISRFHAFFRETPWGLQLVDAKSANGTWLAGARVPQQGAGEAPIVSSGDGVRFGDIKGVIVDAAGLSQLVAPVAP